MSDPRQSDQSLLLVETPQSIHHSRYGRHNRRGVSTFEITTAEPAVH